GSYPNSVVVTSGSVTSSAGVTITAPALTLGSISPATGGTLTATNVTISGSNFVAGATAMLGNASLTNVTVLNASQMTAVVPAGLIAGVFSLTVTNPDSQADTLANAFTVQVLAPVIANVTPANAIARTITVNGANIASTATVQLGATALSNVTYISPTQLTAIVPQNFAPGVYSLTIRNPDGQTGALANAFTVSAAPTLSPSLATVCNTATMSNASCLTTGATTAAGLLPTFQDDFTSTTLNTSKWSLGRTNLSGSATITNNIVLVKGAYISSNTNYARNIVEGRVSFSNVAGANQNFGWATTGLPLNTGPWAMFGVPSSDPTAVYARTSIGRSSLQTKIATVSFNTFYNFKIVVGTTNVQYFVNNTLVATHNLTTSTSLNVFLYSSSTNNNNLQSEWIQVNAFPTSGTFTSATIDAGSQVIGWGVIGWNGTVPTGAALSVQTQTSVDGTNWSAWSTAVSVTGASITNPPGRYIRYRLSFTSSANRAWTPSVTSVTIGYTLQ
ncbi:IPT/TIG domain-containing protein, partial [Candidatus Chlorohelix sp.]|uniref:IPT/TIG domain-containing protein n=1 Tax=Candidatus Chlorohelix sp. TaxID=3139201 RepID=UPI00301ECD34